MKRLKKRKKIRASTRADLPADKPCKEHRTASPGLVAQQSPLPQTLTMGRSLDLSGVWLVSVKKPATAFRYALCQHKDFTVTGNGTLLNDSGTPDGPKLQGRVQGYVFTWTEETGGKFRATLAPDCQSFAGTGALTETETIEFDAVRSVAHDNSGVPDRRITIVDSDSSGNDSARCTCDAVEQVFPGLLGRVSNVTDGLAVEVCSSDLLRGCPLELSAQRSLVPLIRALVAGRPEDLATVTGTVHALALADWLGCCSGAMSGLVAVTRAQAFRVPAMLDAADLSSPSVAHVLRRGLLITDTAVVEALARDVSRERWCTLCGEEVLRCLARLGACDPDALRLSRAAAAALELGIGSREVHAILPPCLRLDWASACLTLNLRKRPIGPEGAARLELPAAGLEEVDLDLTRCGVRAVGAASLQLPAGLRRLRLVLQKCDIGPEGAKGLALPSSLTRLDLDLSHCLIGPAGAAALQLPCSLVELDLSLVRCGIGDRGAKALVLPEGLDRLTLNLARCAIGPEGARVLRLPPRMASCSIDLTMCQIGLEGLKALLSGLPPTLESLELFLHSCGLDAEVAYSIKQSAVRRLPNLRSHTFQCS